MYIKNIALVNVKLFDSVNLDFTNDDSPRMWTVLVGENGLGKTTILQAIAMTASGSARANQLANIVSLTKRTEQKQVASAMMATFSFGSLGHDKREYPGIYRKNTDTPLLQSILLSLPERAVVVGDSFYVDASGNKIGYHQEEIARADLGIPLDFGNLSNDPVSEARAKNTPGWLVVGYGVDRRLPSPKNAPKLDDPAYQRLASLFDKGSIIATGFADLFATKEKVRQFSQSLKKALLENTKLLPRILDVELRGQSGASSARRLIEGDRFSIQFGHKSVKIPATWLSQGYQATIAWIADLIGQCFWDAREKVMPKDMEGLVLIDEIDIHLHPTWQVHLIEALKATFPRLQFVVTMHSPMVLPGLKKEEILRIRQTEEGAVVVESVDESPAVMTGSELYEAFFGIEGLFAREVGDQLHRYTYLSNDPFRSDDEDREMIRIQQNLKQADVLPHWEPVAREKL